MSMPRDAKTCANLPLVQLTHVLETLLSRWILHALPVDMVALLPDICIGAPFIQITQVGN